MVLLSTNMEIKHADFVKGIRGTDAINDDGVPHIAFLGRSNVGKSSVINMLLNRKALVKSSSTPGKTQEINFFRVNKEYYFVDLPGYGYAKLGKSAREKLRKLIMWYVTENHPEERTLALVLDAQVGLTDYDREILDIAHAQEESLVIVLNKMDKLNQRDRLQAYNRVAEETTFPIIKTSASKKRGRDDFFDVVFSQEINEEKYLIHKKHDR